MITLCMDTSHRYLTLALIQDGELLASFQKECFKRQSETILFELDTLCQKAGIKNQEINEVCITKGPGSYTGVRIAMTIAKILCTQRNLPLYTLSTLKLFSCGESDCAVILDARGHRAYTAIYENGVLQNKETVLDLDVLKQQLKPQTKIMGDRGLLGMENQEMDYCLSFLMNRDSWQRVENAHTCVPEYLKDNNEYLVK